MKNKVVRLVLMLFMILTFAFSHGCGGCGADDGEGESDGDAAVDGEDEGGADISPDEIDDPVDSDPSEDDIIEEDWLDDDGAGPGEAHMFLGITSGGARRQSDNYIIELFFAPQEPIGKEASSNYSIRLGPGAKRRQGLTD